MGCRQRKFPTFVSLDAFTLPSPPTLIVVILPCRLTCPIAPIPINPGNRCGMAALARVLLRRAPSPLHTRACPSPCMGTGTTALRTFTSTVRHAIRAYLDAPLPSFRAFADSSVASCVFTAAPRLAGSGSSAVAFSTFGGGNGLCSSAAARMMTTSTLSRSACAPRLTAGINDVAAGRRRFSVFLRGAVLTNNRAAAAADSAPPSLASGGVAVGRRCISTKRRVRCVWCLRG